MLIDCNCMILYASAAFRKSVIKRNRLLSYAGYAAMRRPSSPGAGSLPCTRRPSHLESGICHYLSLELCWNTEFWVGKMLKAGSYQLAKAAKVKYSILRDSLRPSNLFKPSNRKRTFGTSCSTMSPGLREIPTACWLQLSSSKAM